MDAADARPGWRDEAARCALALAVLAPLLALWVKWHWHGGLWLLMLAIASWLLLPLHALLIVLAVRARRRVVRARLAIPAIAFSAGIVLLAAVVEDGGSGSETRGSLARDIATALDVGAWPQLEGPVQVAALVATLVGYAWTVLEAAGADRGPVAARARGAQPTRGAGGPDAPVAG